MRYFSLVILITLAFIPLPLTFIGIDEKITRLIIDVIIFLLFVFGEKSIITIKFILPLLLFSFISFFLSEVEPLLFLVFLRRLILPLMLFTYILNTKFKQSEINKFFNLIFHFSIFQIIVVVIKFLTVGVVEEYSGTFSLENGSISTIFPLMVISYLISKFLILKQIRYLFYIITFSLISFVGNKLAVYIYLVLLFIILIVFFQKKVKRFRYRQLISLSALICFIFYIALSYNPRLKSSDDIDGIDWDYAIEFVTNYEARSFESDDGLNRSGRLSSIELVLDFMQSKTLIEYLFGNGPGDIVKSSLVAGQTNKLQLKYELGYGSRLAVWWIFLQLGLIGIFVFLRLQWQIYKLIIAKIDQVKNYHDLIFGIFVFGLFIIFQFDIFSYSSTLIVNNSMTTLYYICLGFILTGNRYRWQIRK